VLTPPSIGGYLPTMQMRNGFVVTCRAAPQL
jgi:hypothetical protein